MTIKPREAPPLSIRRRDMRINMVLGEIWDGYIRIIFPKESQPSIAPQAGNNKTTRESQPKADVLKTLRI